MMIKTILNKIHEKMLDINKLPQLQSVLPSKKSNRPTCSRRLAVFFTGKRGLITAFAVLFLMYLALCLYSEHRLKAEVYTVFKEIGANGFGVSYQARSSFAGLAGGLHLDNVVLTAPRQMGGWQLKTGRLVVSAGLFSRAATIRFNGTHSLKTDRFDDARFILDDAKLTVAPAPLTVNVRIKKLQTASPDALAGLSVQEASLSFSAATGNFSLTMNGAVPPASVTPPLAPSFSYFSVSGTVTDIPDKNRQAPVLAEWINNGGLIEITRAEAIWLPFMAQLSGTASLDNNYTLTAAGTGKVYGFFDLLNRLEKIRAVSPSQVSLAKIVLGERVRQMPGEALPSLTTSFGIQNQTVYAERVPLN